MACAVTGGVDSVLVPLTAVVALLPTAYGDFSVLYLLLAFALSVQLSILSDAWARSRTWPSSTWSAYSGVSLSLSLLVIVVALCVSPLLGLPMVSKSLIAVAAGVTVWRAASRYRTLADARYRRVVTSDAGSSMAFLVSMTLTFGVVKLDGSIALAASWLMMNIVASLVLPSPTLRLAETPVRWIAERRRIIVPLLGDSLLMDTGAIGGPLLIAPMLGPHSFGIYRAVSNIAMPVRLFLDPIRPSIASARLDVLARLRTLVIVSIAAAALGVAAYVALAFALPLVPLRLGTLESLVPYASGAAVFVSASFLGHASFLVARRHVPGRSLLSGRVVQTILTLILPAGGLVLDGLNGAIWGFSIGTLLSATVWAAIVRGHWQKRASVTT